MTAATGRGATPLVIIGQPLIVDLPASETVGAYRGFQGVPGLRPWCSRRAVSRTMMTGRETSRVVMISGWGSDERGRV